MWLRPVTLRIAVDRREADDQQSDSARPTFASESRTVSVSDHDRRNRSKHSPCLVLASRPLRSSWQLEMSADAQTAPSVRKNFVLAVGAFRTCGTLQNKARAENQELGRSRRHRSA